MELRFISKNKQKLEETKKIFEDLGIKVIASKLEISEIQNQNNLELVKDKLLKAFRKVQKPLFLEHTGLYFDAFNNYPGGLTESFWKSLGAENITKRFKGLKVRAKTTIAYCDGKKIHYFDGEISGKIASQPSGSSKFQWDTIFIPDGYKSTFAKMGVKKNEISMRRIAIDKFHKHLKNGESQND